MARTWTERQTDAMNTRDRTLLVSAAAGSGKTATLTERIIRSILDEDDPININEMLIVTFTKAATGELRDRISGAIKSALAASGADPRLEAQLHLLPSAKISTIDSFCSAILKNNCERVGVDPGYRILDPAEAELLAEGILDGMFAEIYEDRLTEVATAEEIFALADCLTDTRSQGDLAAIIRMFYDTTKDLEEGVGKIRQLVEEYNTEHFTSVEETRLGKYAMSAVRDYAEHHLREIEECLREHIEDGSSGLEKKIRVLEGDRDYLRSVLRAERYNELREIVKGRVHPSTPSVGSCAPHLRYATALRSALKDDTKAIIANFLDYSEEEWRATYDGLYRMLSVLVRLLEHFHSLFEAEKLRLSALEYSDVTRYTYMCLWQGGERTDVAISESSHYRAVYVDEYQGVNALQHKIFEAISTPTNRFMVGDIKQSIYGFRGADPTIFAKLKTTLPTLGDDGDYPGATIFMSENFRCDRGIIDFVNEIFDRLFLVLRESIGYLPEDRLIFKKPNDGAEPEYKRAEICLLPYRIDKSGLEEETEEDPAPILVAEKIRELLATGTLNDGRPITPGDVAIIMRNAHGKDSKYAAALERLGIPVAISDTESFFMNSDILLVMSILEAIDNPRRDIYLAAAMCSPVFGFNADDLVRITAAGEPTLYDGLLRYARENPDAERERGLLARLSRYRTLSEGMPAHVLINRIYKETGLLALAAKRGGRDELIRFMEHARQYEGSSYNGLYNFLSYVRGIVDRQNSFDKREANLSGDEVKIITAHSSKGLEFPVVFFVGSDQAMKRRGDGERLIYDNRFGLAMNLRTPSGLSLVSGPAKPILAHYKLRQRIEEEARVLYVILTRARERLYVVGKARCGYEKYSENISAAHNNLSRHRVYGMASYTDMITFSSGHGFMTPDEFLPKMSDELRELLCPTPKDEDREDGGFVLPESMPEELAFGEDGSDNVFASVKLPDDGVRVEGYGEEKQEKRLCEILLDRFTYKYPYADYTTLPKKLSVSKLYPEILDPRDEETVLLEGIDGEDERITKMGILPRFATASDPTESARRGIATHLLFQFCNLEGLRDMGARAELLRLKEENYLSDEDAERVRIREVEAFRSSNLFSEMLNAVRIWRELRFNTLLPASMLTSDGERRAGLGDARVLVQGVIDCLYEDKNGDLHLVDYKTDRLTREEREDPDLAEKRLRDAHSLQLSYYSEAVLRMFGKRPVTVEVYSLQLGRCVDVRI